MQQYIYMEKLNVQISITASRTSYYIENPQKKFLCEIEYEIFRK